MPALLESRFQSETNQSEKSKENENYSHLPYFTADEVSIHNKPQCCWVVIFGLVRDLSSLLQEYRGKPEVATLLKFAGEDISHWFDKETGDIRYYIHPETAVRVPFTPFGTIPHVDTHLPSYNWKGLTTVPWWKDERFIVGKVTKKTLPINIVNVLTHQSIRLEVCCEDTLRRIEGRYSKFNSNTQQYLWKYNGRVLDMDITLEENGIVDRLDLFDACFMPRDYYVPSIFIYFMDEI